MEEKSSYTPILPAEARDFVERIARNCSVRRSIRKEVRRELSAHFQDALSDVAETEKDAGVQELIKDFGDPTLLAALIGRGKRRCQPWWERALIMSVKVTAVLLVFGVSVDVVLSKRSGEALQNEIARIHSTGAPTSAQEIIEQARKDNGANALSKEERLKRCPATTLLYELSKLKIDMDAEAHGKRISDMDRSSASVLCDAWDADMAAAVGETLSRNREAIDKVRALAVLPPDDPADTIWFQTTHWPEKCRESGIPLRDLVISKDLEMLAGPDDLMNFMDIGSALILDAAKAIQEQRPDAALDDATMAMALANHVGKTCRTVVGSMVAIALRSEAVTSIVQPLLNLADVSEGAEARFLNAAGQMNCSEALAKSLAWERMFLIRALSMIKNGEHIFASAGDNHSLSERLFKSPFDPLVLRARLLPFLHNEDAMTALESRNRLVEAMSLPYPEYKALSSTWRDTIKNRSSWAAPIARFTMVNVMGCRDNATLCQTNEDLARVAFALRRFKLVQGAYPDCLQALEPTCMSKLPVDRYGGGQLLYRKQEEGCVIYSVFINLRDDGGKEKGAEDRGAPDDLVWKLTR